MEVEKYMADPETQLDIGPNDVVGRLFKGKEHPGRVRGLGFGPVPSQAFDSASSHRSTSTSRCQDSVPIADFRRFSDGVISLLGRLVEANPNVPADLAQDVGHFTQKFTQPSSQHSHQPSTRVASDMPASSLINITGVSSDGVPRTTAPADKSNTSTNASSSYHR
ncbi:hypothetical protein LINGRAHAP2_LOCUS20342, partial [Linum grandiflorum]